MLDFTVLKVRQDRVRDPRQGREHRRVVIEAPTWVTVLALTEAGEAVLVRQFRFGIWGETLELPGGIVEPGEPPLKAARRELEEETGYRPRRMKLLGRVHPNPALQDNWCYSFLAEDCRRVHDGRPDESEHLRVELHPEAALDGLIAGGEITHSLTVTALYFRLAGLPGKLTRAAARPPPRRRATPPLR